MTPAVNDLPDQYAGDTFAARTYTVTRTVAGVTTPENLTGVAIRLDIASGAQQGPTVIELAVGSGITVVNAAGGVFRVEPFAIPAAGAYRYDIQFAYPDGRVRTYLRGRMTVLADVTQ